MLRSDICGYSDVYVVVKGRIYIRVTNNANRIDKKANFQEYASFRSCISKTNNTFIDNADVVMILVLLYQCIMLEYSDSYSMTSGSLWNYYRDEVNYSANEIDDDNTVSNNKTTTSKSFKYKTKMVGSTPSNKNIRWRSSCAFKIFE